MSKKGKHAFKIVAIVLISVAALLLLSAGALVLYAKRHVNYTLDDALFAAAKGESVIRLYADGEEGEAVLFEEVCLLGYRKENVTLDRVPKTVRAAFLAAEDREFYRHHGVNVRRTLMAAINYITKRSPTFGASTITQQVVKNVSGDSEVTVGRKLSEMLRALHMENTHSKDEIFELYLNIVPMSESIVGIAKAAEVYFGKEVEQLTYAEAAVLAGIANAPTRYNPHRHPEAAKEKRDRVLYAMLDAGYIDGDTYQASVEEPLCVKEKSREGTPVMSWFAEAVLKEVEGDLVAQHGMTPEAAHRYVMHGGFSVKTTVNARAQEILEAYFSDPSRFPAGEEHPTYAMCVCNSLTGELVAVVGRSGEKDGNLLLNHATDLPHTPGSVLKPLALYAPLLNEKRIHAATVFDDVPVEFKEQGTSYVAFPRNSPAIYQGLTTVSDALRLSKNTVAVRLYQLRGAEEIYRSLHRDFDFDTVTRSAYGSDGGKRTDLAPSPLALGQLTYGIPLRKLTEAYCVFPSEGVVRSGRSYREVTDGAGRTLLKKEQKEKRVYSEECARIMNQLLSGVTDSGTAKSIQLKYMVDTAGKTGTSGDDRDRMFIGYTPYFTAGIWCGYESGDRSLSSVRVSHLTAWDEVMRQIHEVCVTEGDAQLRHFSTEGLVRCAYCMDSGELFTPTCALDARGSRMGYAYFTPDNRPTGVCSRHVAVDYDTLTSAIAHEGCPIEELGRVALIRVDDRHFPMQLYVRDAEYVYRPLTHSTPLGESFDCPYFVHSLREGDYCGISLGRKQFNSACYLHDAPAYRYRSDEEDTSSA